MSNDAEIRMIVRLIKKGFMTLDDVPAEIREAVKSALKG